MSKSLEQIIEEQEIRELFRTYRKLDWKLDNRDIRLNYLKYKRSKQKYKRYAVMFSRSELHKGI